jgi:hypothetical protein
LVVDRHIGGGMDYVVVLVVVEAVEQLVLGATFVVLVVHIKDVDKILLEITDVVVLEKNGMVMVEMEVMVLMFEA